MGLKTVVTVVRFQLVLMMVTTVAAVNVDVIFRADQVYSDGTRRWLTTAQFGVQSAG